MDTRSGEMMIEKRLFDAGVYRASTNNTQRYKSHECIANLSVRLLGEGSATIEGEFERFQRLLGERLRVWLRGNWKNVELITSTSVSVLTDQTRRAVSDFFFKARQLENSDFVFMKGIVHVNIKPRTKDARRTTLHAMHRDVKPSNIPCTKMQNRRKGQARIVDSDQQECQT